MDKTTAYWDSLATRRQQGVPEWWLPVERPENPLDEADFPPLDLGDDETPCVYCGETECERSCTGGMLADEAGGVDEA